MPQLPLAYGREQVLLQFLNLDFSTLKYDGHNYVDAAGRQVGGELHLLIHRDLSLNLPVNAFFTDSEGMRRSGNSLEALQTELIEVLLPITEAKWRSKSSRPMRIRMQDYLVRLVATLNEFHFETRFNLLSGDKRLFDLTNSARALVSRDKRHQGIFAWGSEWIVRMAFSAGSGYAPRRDFFGLIAEGMISGELALLRRCPCCRTFFVAHDPRSKFMPGHTRFYYDKQRGSDRVKQWRTARDQIDDQP
jgi:hypothetical protein